MPRRDLRPLGSTDLELDALAEVSASDVQDAQLAWKKDAPERFANLLDATAIEETIEPEEG